ncbi:sulfate/molybdate ABC transporter ATP-binding protein [Microbacterium thalassium]|uniref:Molybdate transport system ATP-binding protein n=1 Tax=Microbacterium thalassium TaxID=362649 RepID=A0A7X0KW18_9MICO|nr:ABC transporter ATP-binding protein [Microbacterium thalassium]MBB6392836.1 molybdate transport system ATP-binding protein [Microbacterium thalassium]GLK22933.1 molybdenum ABC transporter ATP-binding protein [Microbacterium thalassium]
MTASALDAHVVLARGGFALDARIAVPAGETLAVMGPSGAGKSTLLAVLAGLVAPRDGHVRVGERMLDSARPRVRTPPSRRGVVLLGQDAQLFPHMTVRENIVFGPRAHGVPRERAERDADDWLYRVGLAGLGSRRPAQLSGGQQQRVALARALATEPAVLLLDEPLTSLDIDTAADIRALLAAQLAATRTTAVVATHDAVDAVALAAHLAVLEHGRVTQSGPVRAVLAEPATPFAAAVAGMNRVEGVVRGGSLETRRVGIPVTEAAASGLDGRAAAAVFRPSAVTVDAVAADSWTAALRLGTEPGEWLARVSRLEPTPAGVRVRTGEPDVAADLPADAAAALRLAPGTPVRLRVDPAAVRLVPGPEAAASEEHD